MQSTAERPKRNAIKTSTAQARQLFLYGEGDGRRIVDTTELSKKTGTSRPTLSKYLPEWEKEAEEMLRSTTKLGVSTTLSVDPVNHQINSKDIDFIRKRMDDLMYEVDNIDIVIDKQEQFLQAISEFQDKPDIALALFDKYLRFCMNRKNLMKQFIELKTVWNKEVGIDAIRSIAEATSKAASVAALKAQDPSPEQPTGSIVGGGVFSKR